MRAKLARQICGSNNWQPSTRGGKVFALGLSIFSVIMIAAYTANLAVFLGNRPDAFLVSTLEVQLNSK
jgi:hypothetical protein